jgi:hypothetical protein
MKTRCLNHRGAATLPARWSTGATCRGRPRRHLPVALKCHRCDSRRRPRATGLWARARDKQLALPERTSGRPALVRRPVGREPLSRRDPHPAKPTPREDRRSCRPPPASFTTALTAPTLTPCRGIDRGEDVRLGVDAERAAGSGFRCRPAAPAIVTYLGRLSPRRSRVPYHRRGPMSNPGRRRGRGDSPRAGGERVAAVEAADRSGVAPELAGSKRVAPEQGLLGRPVKKPRVRSKM